MIPDAEIPRDLVIAFAEHMAASYRARIANKNGADGALLDAGLRVLGLDPSRYATTIGRTIYVPQPIGSPHAAWDLWGQIVTITHECQHLAQTDRLGLLPYAWRYASQAGRTALEAEAYSTELDLMRWRRGSVGMWWPAWRAQAIRSYLVSEADEGVMRRHLASLAATSRRGGTVTSAGVVALDWLDRHAPELRHPTVADGRQV